MPSPTLARPAEVADRTPWPRAPTSWVLPPLEPHWSRSRTTSVRVSASPSSRRRRHSRCSGSRTRSCLACCSCLPPSRWPRSSSPRFRAPDRRLAERRADAPAVAPVRDELSDRRSGVFLSAACPTTALASGAAETLLVFLACAALRAGGRVVRRRRDHRLDALGHELREALTTLVRANCPDERHVVPAIVPCSLRARRPAQAAQSQVLEAAVTGRRPPGDVDRRLRTQARGPHLPALLLRRCPSALGGHASRIRDDGGALFRGVRLELDMPCAAAARRRTVSAGHDRRGAALPAGDLAAPALPRRGGAERQRSMARCAAASGGRTVSSSSSTRSTAPRPAGLASLDRELRFVSVTRRSPSSAALPASAHIGRSIRRSFRPWQTYGVPDHCLGRDGGRGASTGAPRRDRLGSGRGPPLLVSCAPCGKTRVPRFESTSPFMRSRAESAPRGGAGREARMMLAGTAANLGFW